MNNLQWTAAQSSLWPVLSDQEVIQMPFPTHVADVYLQVMPAATYGMQGGISLMPGE